MSLIVCATGNGDRSRSVQARAVEAARRQQKRLVFVHVVDVEQLAGLDESLREAARAELAWLGSAIMRLAHVLSCGHGKPQNKPAYPARELGVLVC